MAGTIRLRTRVDGGVATVRALIRHPMRVGDPGSGPGAGHYITHVVCEHDGDVVLNAYWGPGISENPYLSFSFDGAHEGDRFVIKWSDNAGREDALETRL